MASRETHELAVLLVQQQRAATRVEARRALQAFLEPIEGSKRFSELSWLNAQSSSDALGAVLVAGADAIAKFLIAADEHSRGLETLLAAQDILPIPAMTLTRSVHDVFLTICTLTDPAIDPGLRIARAAAVTMGSVQENLRALVQFPNPPAETVANARAGMLGMQEYLEHNGFRLKFPDNGSPYATSISYGQNRASMKINTTQASEKYMPGTHYMWSVASGATHSRDWFTSGLEGARSELAIMLVAPLFDFCDVMVDNLTRYVGVDANHYHRRTHTRRHALLLRREGSAPSPSVGHTEYAIRRDRS